MFQAAILKLPEGGIPLASGLHPGVRHNMSPMWLTGNNVRFNNASLQKAQGFTQAFNTANNNLVLGCQDQLTSAGQALYYGTTEALYKWNSITEANVGQIYTGFENETVTQEVSLWTMATWGDWVVASNGVNPVQVYKGVSFADLANTPFTHAKIIIKWGPYLIAMNTSNGENIIEWCTDDDIENWTINATTTAGNYNIRDLESGIVAACKLGNRIAIFAKDSMHLLQYTGSTFIFGVSAGPTGLGAVSRQSVVSVDDKVYGLGQEGFFLTDGNSAQYIDEPAIRTYYKERINTSQLSKVCSYHNEAASTVVWYLPDTQGDVTWSVSFDYKRRAWSIGDYGRTACIPRQVFSYPVTFGTDFIPYFENFGDNADSLALNSFVESKPFDGGDMSIEKWFDSMIVLGRTTGTLYISLGFQNTLADPIRWITQVFTGDADPLYYEQTARWVRLKIFSVDVDCDWEISQITLHGRKVGGGLR